jgi:tetratricopeptide (TPR) repeat protein
MRAHFQGQPRPNRPRSRPFPWVRLVIALLLTVLFFLGATLQILSTGNIISNYWLFIIPPIIAVIALLIPLYQWLFPISPGDTTNHPSQLQQLPSIHLTTQSNASSPTTPLWNVPYPHNPFFIGREALLTQLYDTLHNEKAAALTQAISGLGGIGKTQLAVEYAYRNRDKYQSIPWTTATTYETLFTDFVALAGLLDLPEKDSQDQTITVNAVKHWLESNSQWLLIMDNADDLEILRDFLPTGGKGHLILTTRSQATGAVAQSLEVKELETVDGAVMLLRRAGIIPPEASLVDASDENQADARAIAHLLDGLPLALDQAGAYIEEMRCSLADYRERYQTERATMLKERGRFFSAHPASVTTTFSLSFQQVQKANPASADLLRFFAFLSPEAIPIDLLREGAPDLGKPLKHIASHPQQLDRALSTLYSYSLVRRDATTNTLYVHRLVQAVLRDEMSARTQHQWAERTVRAVNRTFPFVQVETWQRCQRLIPQVLVCRTLIDQWHMNFPEAARLLNEAGYYLREHAQYTEAEPLLKHSLAIYEKRLGPDHLDTAISFTSLATLYESQGKYEQAEPLFLRSLAFCEQRLGPDHPYTATSLNNLAAIYANQGKDEQAELLYQRALTIREKRLGPDHPDTAWSLYSLAFIYHNQGKDEQAELLYQRALAIYEKRLVPDHPDTAWCLNDLGNLYYDQDKYEQAEPLYQRALAIYEKRLDPDHPATKGV